MLKCWDAFKCKKKECPAYKLESLRCWLVPGTQCRDEIQGKFIDKVELCLGCKVFKANIDPAAMRETLKVLNKQFKEFRALVKDRDRELESIGLELALSLSEVFEALDRISSGDPLVRISETSSIELIKKLKHLVNMTARNIGEIVDQSHEFAMGLAEHFDVLNRVSKGDLDSRVSGSSQIELLESFKKVTNKMIDSIAREITERKKMEEWYRTVFENTGTATVIVENNMIISLANTEFEKLSGYSKEEIEGKKKWIEFIVREDVEKMKELHRLRRIDPTKAPSNYEFRFRKRQGNVRDIFVSIAMVPGTKKSVASLLDITDRKKAEEVLHESSIIDELTGLYNRRGFFSLGEQQVKIADRELQGMLIIYADLDDLKWINDNMGHGEGDLALIEIAKVLKETFRTSDIIARIGGDEFVVLALKAKEADASIITARLFKNLTAHNAKEDRSYNLSLSIGIAYYDPENPIPISELLSSADKLMYEQKQNKQYHINKSSKN